ncbi:MAG: ribonuclease Z [Methanobacteriota archaeon]|nr:MAG: ribonuclease Z [Euryarchaeota archaeon]
MKVFFLGTGGTYPSKTRNVSSVAIQVGPDVVMLDCGEGTQRQLMHSPVSFMRVRAVFITHLHADHFLGLAGLVQSMSLNGRTEPLLVMGPVGTAETAASMLGLGHFKSQFDVKIGDMRPGDQVDFEQFFVRCAEAAHTVPALAFCVEEPPRPGRFDTAKAKALGVPPGPMYRKLQEGEAIEVDGRTVRPDEVMGAPRPGRKVVYTGDTKPCSSVESLAEGADVLIHDSTMGSAYASQAAEFGHSTSVEAAEVAKKAGVKQLFLVHMSPRYDDATELEAEAREVFAETTAASDFDIYEVRYRK